MILHPSVKFNQKLMVDIFSTGPGIFGLLYGQY